MALGSIIFFQGDFGRADGLLEESAALARDGGEPSTARRPRHRHDGGDWNAVIRRAPSDAAVSIRRGRPGRRRPWLECFSLTYQAYGALYAG